MEYIDKYGLYHDKPVRNREPSSNNGWIYTSYAKSLGHVCMSKKHYENLFSMCIIHRQIKSDFYLSRLPNKLTPPISRDELIGMASLGMDIGKILFARDYYFCRMNSEIRNTSIWESIKVLYSIKDEHRNHVWQNSLYKGYKLAFRLAPHDIYYIKKISNWGDVKLYESILFNLYCLSTVIQNNISARNVLWLQLRDLKSTFWIRFINQPDNFSKYFSEKHIFNRP